MVLGDAGKFIVGSPVQFATRLVSTAAVRDLEIDPFGGFDPTRVWLRRGDSKAG